MNVKVKELGLIDYKFVNVIGFENKDFYGYQFEGISVDEESEVFVKDMVIFVDYLIIDYFEILEIFSIVKMKFREGIDDEMDMLNWNFMLKGFVSEYKKVIVDGLKIGFIDFVGLCFIGIVEFNGMCVIIVVLNVKGNLYIGCFDEMKKMFDYVFNNFFMKEIYVEGD